MIGGIENENVFYYGNRLCRNLFGNRYLLLN